LIWTSARAMWKDGGTEGLSYETSVAGSLKLMLAIFLT
jgi:hypothetical protein